MGDTIEELSEENDVTDISVMGKGLDMQGTLSMDVSISPSKLDIGIGLTEELGPSTNISNISVSHHE